PPGGWCALCCPSSYRSTSRGPRGDAVMILTNPSDLAERLRGLRHHGDGGRYRHLELGYSSRLDDLQAALLRAKLGRLEAWTAARRRIAARYHDALARLPLTLPIERGPARHGYHLYTIRHRQRDALAKTLAQLGVGTAVHYPIAVPGQPMFGLPAERQWPEATRASREVLSLPCYAELTDDEVNQVTRAVRTACEGL